jgi:cytochrome c553
MNTKSTRTAAVLLLISACFTQTALASGDVEAGAELGYTCLGCHGIQGYRNAYPSYRVPKLGGQKAAYLVAALNGYRDGTRQHPTMSGQASSLSDKNIEDVAAYLASLGGDTVAAGGSEAESIAAATTCVACHGKNGISVNAEWPTLAGQHEDYLVHALTSYRDGSRSNPIMGAQAAMIGDDDVAVLAKYFASLDGLETTKSE